MYLLVGVMFLVIGNYLPKCRQNYTIGIKIKWALASEENWNATHRFGGRVWVIGGVLILLCMFLPDMIGFGVMMTAVLLSVILPTVYSYRYYKKQVAAGEAPAKAVVPTSRGMKILAAVMLALIAVLVVTVLFTGDVEIEFGAESFTVDADFWSPMTVAYTEIRDIEYRDSFDAGIRMFGLGSARLLAGAFENEEFGSYTLYAYTACNAVTVIEIDERTLVISGRDAAETRGIYETISAELAKRIPTAE